MSVDGHPVQLSVEHNCVSMLRPSQSVTTRATVLLQIVQSSRLLACVLEPSHIARHKTLERDDRQFPIKSFTNSDLTTPSLQILRVCADAPRCSGQCQPAGEPTVLPVLTSLSWCEVILEKGSNHLEFPFMWQDSFGYTPLHIAAINQASQVPWTGT